MPESDFMQERQSAVDKMREMNSRSKFTHKNSNENNPPQNKKTPQNNQNNLFQGGFNIPFLKDLQKDGDLSLILGLLLLLMSEKSDKTLLFALLYILL